MALRLSVYVTFRQVPMTDHIPVWYAFIVSQEHRQVCLAPKLAQSGERSTVVLFGLGAARRSAQRCHFRTPPQCHLLVTSLKK
jgi:hypothetical protein